MDTHLGGFRSSGLAILALAISFSSIPSGNAQITPMGGSGAKNVFMTSSFEEHTQWFCWTVVYSNAVIDGNQPPGISSLSVNPTKFWKASVASSEYEDDVLLTFTVQHMVPYHIHNPPRKDDDKTTGLPVTFTIKYSDSMSVTGDDKSDPDFFWKTPKSWETIPDAIHKLKAEGNHVDDIRLAYNYPHADAIYGVPPRRTFRLLGVHLGDPTKVPNLPPPWGTVPEPSSYGFCGAIAIGLLIVSQRTQRLR